jgi:phage terminase Nu1 subunit (DNA packaging protein)
MATVPSDLVREFEAMGEPVVAHRFTRFDDARMRAAAQEWLAQRTAEREAALDAAESEAERRGRRITAALAVATVLGWGVALAIIFG